MTQGISTYQCNGGLEAVCWRRLYGQRHIVERNLRKSSAYVHACRGHNGTITCLARSAGGRGGKRIFSGALHNPVS